MPEKYNNKKLNDREESRSILLKIKDKDMIDTIKKVLKNE